MSSGPDACRSRTRRDIATSKECKGSFCGWDIQPLLSRMCIHLLWSTRCLWRTRFHWSGHNCHNQVSRKGRETEVGSRNSHFQLQPDAQSQEMRRHRKGEPQFSSWGADRRALVSHKPGKKGSSSWNNAVAINDAGQIFALCATKSARQPK